MLIYEYKLDGTPQQYAAVEEAIRVVQFIRNKGLRLWMDTRGTSKNDQNRKKARRVLAKQYLKVQRQREDFARKQANALVSSHDVIAFEALQIRNMVRNRHLARVHPGCGLGHLPAVGEVLWHPSRHPSAGGGTRLHQSGMQRMPPDRQEVPLSTDAHLPWMRTRA
jgi:Probable transposase